MPTERAEGFQVLQGRIPTVKEDKRGSEPPLLGRCNQSLEVIILRLEGIILCLLVVRFVLHSKVAGNPAVSVRPEQCQEVDASDHAMVFSTPMAMDEFDLLA
jgi:hypothetical protein